MFFCWAREDFLPTRTLTEAPRTGRLTVSTSGEERDWMLNQLASATRERAARVRAATRRRWRRELRRFRWRHVLWVVALAIVIVLLLAIALSRLDAGLT